MACQHQYLTGTSCCVAVTVKVSMFQSLCDGQQLLSGLQSFLSSPLLAFLTIALCLNVRLQSYLAQFALYLHVLLSLASLLSIFFLSCDQPSRSSPSHVQTSVMFSPCGESQSLRTQDFLPVAAQAVIFFFIFIKPVLLSFAALCPLSALQQTFNQPSLNRLQSY